MWCQLRKEDVFSPLKEPSTISLNFIDHLLVNGSSFFIACFLVSAHKAVHEAAVFRVLRVGIVSSTRNDVQGGQLQDMNHAFRHAGGEEITRRC